MTAKTFSSKNPHFVMEHPVYTTYNNGTYTTTQFCKLFITDGLISYAYTKDPIVKSRDET